MHFECILSTAAMFDTHCHLHLPEVSPHLSAVLEASREAGVTQWMTLGLGPADWPLAKALASCEAGVFWGAGIHPFALKTWDGRKDSDALGALEKALSPLVPPMGAHPQKPVMLGECGLDARISEEVPLKRQLQVLETQLQMAQQFHLPLSLHVVGAHGELLELLDLYRGQLRGVLHCFSGSKEQARQYLNLGHFAFGFSGNLTLPSLKRTRLVKWLPEDLILTETDAPDGPGFLSLGLSPSQSRPCLGEVTDKRAPCLDPEPALMPWVVQAIAQIRGEKVALWRELSHRNAVAFLFSAGRAHLF